MTAKLRSWWQQIKQHRVAIGVIGIVLVVVITLIIIGYLYDWTGFKGYTQVTTAHTTSGPSAGTVVRTEVSQPGKALWDWLQLLIIPIVLAIAGFWLNQIQKSREQRTAQQQAELEHELTRDNQQENLLQAYIDKMSELLLEKHLRDSQPEDEIRKIARVRTLTVLPRLDANRKGSVLQFLHESGLIDKNRSIVDLRGADLREAHLKASNIGKADLRGTNLMRAKLCHADLSETDLRGAVLVGANLERASLDRADLREADLREAHLTEAFVREADLKEANLNQADLIKARLDGSDLIKVNLGGADLRGADLSGTDLSGAYMEYARSFVGQLDQAKSLKGATLPDGTKHP